MEKPSDPPVADGNLAILELISMMPQSPTSKGKSCKSNTAWTV